jgi:hypothetical protein
MMQLGDSTNSGHKNITGILAEKKVKRIKTMTSLYVSKI